MRSLTDMAGDLNTSTAQVLTALRIVATRAGVEDLAEWATKELEGYEAGDDLLPHRVWRATIVGSLHNPMQGFLTDVHLSDFAIAEQHRKEATTFHCRQGIAVIESSLRTDEGRKRNFEISQPNLAMLVNTGPMSNESWTCTKASARFSRILLEDVVNKARQTALRLCLECEGQGIELQWSEGGETSQEERAQWRRTLREEGTRVALRAAWEPIRGMLMGG